MISITKLTPYLWTRVNALGLYPITIKVSVKKTLPAYIQIADAAVNKNYWDKKKGIVIPRHHQAKEINDKIDQVMTGVKELLKQCEYKKIVLDAAGVKKKYESGNRVDKTNVLDFLKGRLDEIEMRVCGGTFDNYKRYVDNVRRFHNKGKKEEKDYTNDLYFEDIDRDWIVAFEKWLRSKRTPYSIKIFWGAFSGWFKDALSMGVIKSNPLATYPSPDGDPAEKEYFTMDEIRILEEVADNPFKEGLFLGKLSKGSLKEVKGNAWRILIHQETAKWLLFGCFFGLRVSDWENFDPKKNVVNNELRIRPQKTSNSTGAYVTMPLKGSFKAAYDRIKDLEMPTYYTLRERIFSLMKALDWEKHISPHGTRVTFASTICAEHGINVEDCAMYMGITVKTCLEHYYKVSNPALHKRTEQQWEDLHNKDYSKLRVA